MKKNLSECLMVKFEPVENMPADLADFLDGYFTVTACNYKDDGREEYVGYAAMNFDADDLKQQAAAIGVKLLPYTVEKLTSQNWLADNVIEFPPIEVADFCVYGVHEKQTPQTDKLAIRIYAATAFGSSHQTTKSCLQAISDLSVSGAKHRKILDMGTGSGILSLACAKLWAKDEPHIVAADIDVESVNVTAQNAYDNHLEKYIDVVQSDGYQAEIIKQNAPYDIILANILARPLIEMAPLLAAHLAAGGHAVLSGFVDDQIEWVVSAHEKQGLKLLKVYDMDNWHAVLMEKQQ